MYVVDFGSVEATDKAIVGGKGANLGLLTQAGFPVPTGFCVTTDAYSAFVATRGLSEAISALLADAEYDDADDLEARTSRIRELFLTTELPDDLAAAIRQAYAAVGDTEYVAVRSSGTAEDLADASFAGLHDTLLDIRGTDTLLSAVRACWSSLWTARATSYRHRGGFDHSQALLSVVVQRMVSSEVSGVLFTGNPLTTATDECVINASWGLGEGVVSGILTPDNYIVKSDTLRVRETTIGAKEVQVRRDLDRPHGTITEMTADADRRRLTLSDEQAGELVALGLRIQDYYAGFPQDIEWALEGGRFHLLQSRPITGVEFSWDTDLEYWQTYSDRDDRIWTRSLADENWTGAISPLMYSWRAPSWVAGHGPAAALWGFPDIEKTRFWKFHKATAYFNTDLERSVIERTIPRAFRPALMANVPAAWREELVDKPFNWIDYTKMYARVEALRPALYKGFTVLKGWAVTFSTKGQGVPVGQLVHLSDRELKRYIDGQIALEDDYNVDLWTWFFVNARDMLTLLGVLVSQWYDSSDATAFQALLTGVPERTETMKINHWLWELSEEIRHSPTLSRAFELNRDGAFFATCAESEEGRAFLTHYGEFLQSYGHRGQPDRDMYFARRREDPSIDYLSLAAMLSTVASADPEIKERETNRQREEFAAQVIEKIKQGPLGLIKAEVFKVVYDYAIRFVMARDNERNFIDFATMSIREGCMEVGRRLTQRGVFDTEDDLWFLGKDRLYALLDGAPMTPLTRAQIIARRRDFQRMLDREISPTPYVQNGQGVDLDFIESGEDGVLHGTGTARGTVTATARVVRQLKDVGKVKEGEILVVNATDPGWTPVFHIISGIVLETGGILAHGSCLAREYGLPAVQLPNAMAVIPDGATINLSGDRGSITIVEAPAEDAQEFESANI